MNAITSHSKVLTRVQYLNPHNHTSFMIATWPCNGVHGCERMSHSWPSLSIPSNFEFGQYYMPKQGRFYPTYGLKHTKRGWQECQVLQEFYYEESTYYEEVYITYLFVILFQYFKHAWIGDCGAIPVDDHLQVSHGVV